MEVGCQSVGRQGGGWRSVCGWTGSKLGDQSVGG